MIKRFWDTVAPVRPAGQDRGYRRLLRWAALPVTDRRWAAPLCAAALGFGLFAGIAIGPGTSGSFAGGAQIVSFPAGAAEEPVAEESEEGEFEEEEAFPEEELSEEFPEEEFLEEETAEPLEEETEPEVEEEPAPEPKEEAQLLSGVVVHANPAAGSYTLVEPGGLLSAVHASNLPSPGTRVKVPVRTLANGTFGEAGARRQTGAQDAVGFSGIVTFVNPDPAAPSYAVSKRGISLLVRIHPDPAGATPPLPVVGAYATVEADVETPAPAIPPAAPPSPTPSCAPDPAANPPALPQPTAVLWQRSLDADGAPFASSDLAGVVMAVCPSQGQLLLSADDMREAGKDVVVTVPSSIKLTELVPGDSVAAVAAIDAGGALRLTGLASDEHTRGADDRAATQGDLVALDTK